MPLCKLLLRNSIKRFTAAKLFSIMCVFFLFPIFSLASKDRDPFQPVMPAAVQKSLFDYPISALALVGIMRVTSFAKSQSSVEDVVVISDPSNRTYFLKLGDRVGSESAEIKQILSDTIVLKWLVQGEVFIDRLKLVSDN